MGRESAIIFSIAIISGTLVSYYYVNKKPYIASAILGSFGAFGLIYTLLMKGEVNEIRTQMNG